MTCEVISVICGGSGVLLGWFGTFLFHLRSQHREDEREERVRTLRNEELDKRGLTIKPVEKKKWHMYADKALTAEVTKGFKERLKKEKLENELFFAQTNAITDILQRH